MLRVESDEATRALVIVFEAIEASLTWDREPVKTARD